ncbi:MAG: DUF1573 domain-containing protein [Gemmataceae bacterium]
MKRFATLLICAALGAGIASLVLRRASPNGPRVEFPASVDFGEVLPGSAFSGTATVANTGRTPLAFNEVSRSCSCVQAEVVTPAGREPLGNLSIAPGESVTIEVELHSRADEIGPGRETLSFKTNDPRTPDGRIELTYRVKGAVATHPTTVNFGTVVPGVPVAADIDVRATDHETGPRVMRVAGPSAGALRVDSVSVPPGTGGEGSPRWLVQRVRVQLVPAPALGSHEARIEIVAGDARSQPLSVPVYWRVRPPIEVSPASISLPVQSTSGPVYWARCLVRSSSGRAVRVGKIEAPDGFRVSAAPIGQSSPTATAVVSIECLDPDILDRSSDAPLAVRLTLDMDDGREEVVTIPVSRRRIS